MTADQTPETALTEAEIDHLWGTWREGGGLTSSKAPVYVEINKLLADRAARAVAEVAGRVEALAYPFSPCLNRRGGCADSWVLDDEWCYPCLIRAALPSTATQEDDREA